METIDNTNESIPAVVSPGPLVVKAHFPQGTIAIRPNLWHNWTRVAMKAEARAVAAHNYGLVTGDTAVALEAETLESMVSVSAVRHAFHHLYLDWHQLLKLRPKGDEEKVPELATIEVPADRAERREWRKQLKDIVIDRDEAIHQQQSSQPAVPHPLGTNTSELDARFTAQRATDAVTVMLDFYRRVVEHPSPPLRQWADSHKHVLADFASLRQKYHDQEGNQQG